MFGSPFQPVPQPRFELIDRVACGDARDLNADEPAIDVEVGLREDGSLHRWIAIHTQFDAGVQHRPVGESTERADLASRVFGGTGHLSVRRHVDIKD